MKINSNLHKILSMKKEKIIGSDAKLFFTVKILKRTQKNPRYLLIVSQ